jgi:hypothetical protein
LSIRLYVVVVVVVVVAAAAAAVDMEPLLGHSVSSSVSDQVFKSEMVGTTT